MKHIKTIKTSMFYDEVFAWTDYKTDEDFIVYPIEYIDINYARFYRDDTIYTDYSTIYTGHQTFIIKDKVLRICVWIEQGDYDDGYMVVMKVYEMK